jgi:hypothetical protein
MASIETYSPRKRSDGQPETIMTRINLSKLAADVGREQGKRIPRPASQAMAIIRENLAAIETLRAGGATWTVIAAGFAAQGVSHRDGQPLTGKRLTALIDSIRRQDARRQARERKRALRPDLARAPPRPGAARLGLAAELQAPVEHVASHTDGDAEETIRRQQYEATRSLFVKKTKD